MTIKIFAATFLSASLLAGCVAPVHHQPSDLDWLASCWRAVETGYRHHSECNQRQFAVGLRSTNTMPIYSPGMSMRMPLAPSLRVAQPGDMYPGAPEPRMPYTNMRTTTCATSAFGFTCQSW